HLPHRVIDGRTENAQILSYSAITGTCAPARRPASCRGGKREGRRGILDAARARVPPVVPRKAVRAAPGRFPPPTHPGIRRTMMAFADARAPQAAGRTSAADGLPRLHVVRMTSVFEPARLTPAWVPYDPVGGMQNHTAELVRHLDRMGVRQT